ncbi:hypothetical protein [Thiohalophilus sp.]|uniref:hypothetical protein n=1 Tax=Thiohalophilus sp. TaxID=3028392 RepID=UPI003974A894
MVDSVGQTGSRLLDEAAQLCDLLRIAYGTAHRMQQDLHGDTYDRAINVVNQLHDLQLTCNNLFDEVAREVGEMESGEYEIKTDPGSDR